MLLNEISVSHRQKKNLYGSQKINIIHIMIKKMHSITSNLKIIMDFLTYLGKNTSHNLHFIVKSALISLYIHLF